MGKDFRDLGLSDNALKTIEKRGFSGPTIVQEKVIPLILETKKDLLVQSQTGSGKTVAFALPLIEKVKEKEFNQILILSPTRELAIQLSEEIHKLCGRKRIKIALLYGGQSFDSQLKRLKQDPEIIIATPGRLVEHLQRKTYNTKVIKWMILDEVDEMLKAGFADDMEEILRNSNRKRRTFFFSATIPDKINNMAKIYTKRLHKIIINRKKISESSTFQIYVEVLSHDKFKALKKILDNEKDFYGIIFCKSKLKAKHLGERLKRLGFNARGIHGDLAQLEREHIISKFKNKKIKILTATDVASRGLDVQNLTHVINYSLPQSANSYVHRIGRTGRAGKKGTAITFVTPEEESLFNIYRRKLQLDITKKEIINLEEVRLEPEIKKETKKEDVRLFISLGIKNCMNPKKIVEFIEKNSGVLSEKIKNVIVGKTFSFVTTNEDDAEIIIKTFKGKRNGKRNLVEVAKNNQK